MLPKGLLYHRYILALLFLFSGYVYTSAFNGPRTLAEQKSNAPTAERHPHSVTPLFPCSPTGQSLWCLLAYYSSLDGLSDKRQGTCLG